MTGKLLYVLWNSVWKSRLLLRKEVSRFANQTKWSTIFTAVCKPQPNLTKKKKIIFCIKVLFFLLFCLWIWSKNNPNRLLKRTSEDANTKKLTRRVSYKTGAVVPPACVIDNILVSAIFNIFYVTQAVLCFTQFLCDTFYM